LGHLKNAESDHRKGASSEALFEIDVSLFAGYQIAQDLANSLVPPAKLNHPLSDRCARKTASIDSMLHPRGAPEL